MSNEIIQPSTINQLISYLDKRFTEIDQRFTEIDQRFTKMDERFTKVDKRIDGLEGRIVKLERDKQYEHNRNIRISEHSKTLNIFKILNAITVGVKELDFKHFYGPTKKMGEITEFDGLLLIDKSDLPTIFGPNPIIDPSTNNKYTDNHAKLVIIEVKTTLNRAKVNFKINQLLQIHTIIQSIKSNSIRLDQTTEQFREMIVENNIHSLPSDVTMIFAPDFADIATREYIKAICNGTFIDGIITPITEGAYNYYCMRFLHTYTITSHILSDKSITDEIKEAINNILGKRAPTTDDVTAFLTIIKDSSLSKEHKHAILNTYTPYSVMLPALTYATGRIGIYYNNILDSPFGVLPLNHLNHRGGVRRKILQTRKK
jgi:hypothetical protein